MSDTLTPRSGHRLTRTDWAIIVSVTVLSGCVIYLMLDPDPAMRRIQYYHALSTMAQRMAYSFGQIGLTAELEYRRLLELEHIN